MKTNIKAIIMMSILLLCTSQVQAIMYTITDIGTLGSDPDSKAFGINDFGHIVGYSGMVCLEAGRRAFLWDKNNGMQSLGTLGGNHSEAYDINNSGKIVGRSSLSSSEYDVRGFLWENGSMIELPILGGNWGEANSINILGQIVGTSSITDGERNAVLWDNNNITQVNPNSIGDASSINNRGQIVGYSYNPEGRKHAFLWQNGQLVFLEPFGGNYSGAYDINNREQVVGSFDAGYGNYNRMFLWENGVFEDFGEERPTAINDMGQIVGSFGLWHNGTKTALFDLLEDNGNWISLRPEDINNNGQIVGSGYIDGVTHSFLMTPVPEPATILLFCLGGGVLLKRKSLFQ